ncbi:diguanylate cyclase [Hahella aquimaris]|uniref:diguanylate cyclase domain-containing protein n=1 Tax=Hahella sp. HNIBRBA332 TaxID=3015983 RepID=UPI00273BDF6A|nr:diguanylate cyclase [Hahella sp. HNIBRBA332]WLQ16336.1 diguanylate cyclase [Hahella sp. HNIBRBA332]
MNFRLSTLLSITLAGVVIATIGVVNCIVDYESSQSLRRELYGKISRASFQMADRLDRGMYEHLRDMINISALPTVRNLYGSGYAEQINILETLKRTHEYYIWIGLTDRNGRVLRATGTLLKGADVSEQAWWKQGLQGPYASDINNTESAEFNGSSQSNSPMHRYISLAAPIRDAEGASIGVMGAFISWSWVNSLAESVLQHHSQQLELLVLARDGAVLMGPAALMSTRLTIPDSLKEHKNALIVLPDGKQYLVGYSETKGFLDYPGNGWVVIARQESVAALRPLHILSGAIWRWGIVVSVFFAVFGWFISELISRPLKKLAIFANALRLGSAESAYGVTITGPREVQLVAAAIEDLVERIRIREVALERQFSEIDLLYEGSPIGIAMVNQDLSCVRMNSKLAQWCGLAKKEIIGRKLSELKSGLVAGYEDTLKQTIASGAPAYNVEASLCKAYDKSAMRSFVATCLPLRSRGDHASAGAALLISEMTAQREAEYLATHDMLTGLANRRFLTAFLFQEFALAHRNSKKVALLYLDLDQFKNVNDTHGHRVGDALLKEVALRLKGVVRESDLVARIGGDEFAVIALDHNNRNDSARLAKTIIVTLSKPYALENVLVKTSPSIGIAVYPDNATEANDLICCADEAMYEAKKNGPGQFRYYADRYQRQNG